MINYFQNLLQVLKSILIYSFNGLSMPVRKCATARKLLINESIKDGGYEIPKIVWIYWESDDIPLLVQNIIKSNEQKNPNFEFILLNKNTLLKYLPTFEVRTEMPIANKSDLIRLELLYQYGGIWLDASVILERDLQEVITIQREMKADLVGYYSHRSTKDFNFPIIESWFLSCPAKTPLIGRWLNELNNMKILGSKDYFNMLRQRSDYDQIAQNIELPEYLLVYLACQIAMREVVDYTLHLECCEDDAFYLQIELKDIRKIGYAFTQLSNPISDYNCIKLTSRDRVYIDKYIMTNMVRKESLIGKLHFK